MTLTSLVLIVCRVLQIDELIEGEHPVECV